MIISPFFVWIESFEWKILKDGILKCFLILQIIVWKANKMKEVSLLAYFFTTMRTCKKKCLNEFFVYVWGISLKKYLLTYFFIRLFLFVVLRIYFTYHYLAVFILQKSHLIKVRYFKKSAEIAYRLLVFQFFCLVF